MTTTDPALCTNAPTTGFNIPVMANKIARKLRPKEKIKLHLMVIIILFDNEIKCGNSLMSSSTRTISAASTAISLPIPPIAIPTFAFLSAGASFTPSPIIQTASL